VPAQQRLPTADLATDQLHARLIMQMELGTQQGTAQAPEQELPPAYPRAHVGFVALPGASPELLGAMQREIGMTVQVVGRFTMLRVQRHPYAGLLQQLQTAELERFVEAFQQARG